MRLQILVACALSLLAAPAVSPVAQSGDESCAPASAGNCEPFPLARLVHHDPAPGHLAADSVPTERPWNILTLAEPRGAVCVSNPASQNHGHMIYLRASNQPDRYTQMVPEIRSMFYVAHGILRHEADPTGVLVNYKMTCSSPGVPEVSHVVVPAGTTNIVNELDQQGYDDATADYWIWREATCTGGWAYIDGDDRLIAANANNVGPNYGVTEGCIRLSGAQVMMHENGHTVGAVQLSAPHTSLGYHCNDGQDIMCYADGGSGSHYTSTACVDQVHFDCGGDDYFNPAPAPGSYLASHWNLGSPLNSWFAFGNVADLPGPPVGLVASPGPAPGQIRLEWQPPVLSGASPVTEYRVYRILSPGQSSFFAHMVPLGNVTSYIDTIPAPSPIALIYQVAAVNGAGEGDPSNRVASHPMV